MLEWLFSLLVKAVATLILEQSLFGAKILWVEVSHLALYQARNTSKAGT